MHTDSKLDDTVAGWAIATILPRPTRSGAETAVDTLLPTAKGIQRQCSSRCHDGHVGHAAARLLLLQFAALKRQSLNR